MTRVAARGRTRTRNQFRRAPCPGQGFADSSLEVRVLPVSNTATLAAPEAFPASTMYVDAAVGPVVETPCHVTVISEGIDELPCPVTDAAALAGAGGAPVHVVPCADAVVLPSGKQIDT